MEVWSLFVTFLSVVSLINCDQNSTVGSSVQSLLGGSPLSDVQPHFPWSTHERQPTGLWGDLKGGPLPTNIWWENVVLEDGGNVIVPLPYLVKTQDDGLHICQPTKVVQETFIYQVWADNLILGSPQGGGKVLTKYDQLSVTIQWNQSGGSMYAPIVRGMAYGTMIYNNLVPKVSTVHDIVSVNGQNGGQVTGTKFTIQLNNGQSWHLYTENTITFTIGQGEMTGTAAYSGYIRAACEWDGYPNSDVLDQYQGKIPTGGKISATSEGDMGTLMFDWETMGTGELLMFALPHHHDILSGVSWAQIYYNSMKGDMQGAVGSSWSLSYTLTTMTWSSPRGINSQWLNDVKAALAQDVVLDAPAGDPYFGGKELALLARLALIADEVGDVGLANTYRGKIKGHMEAWLQGTKGGLLYDQTWGGIVHVENAFGNADYNDHHFHYGYFLYAYAAVAKEDPSWGAAWNDKILQLVRDIAEPSGVDPFFTSTRNKDWFCGHSWANGIATPFIDSNNQESSSEAINAWYGLYLYGLAMNNAQVKDLGRLMLATEMRSVYQYWQITSSDSPQIYPAPYSNKKVVGILWSTKVDYSTWFGGNPEFIHCIQYLPFTPISEELLRENWIREEWPVLASEVNNPSEEWRGYVVMGQAVIDKQAAWNEAMGLGAFDDGNCKTNTLYWIATRP